MTESITSAEFEAIAVLEACDAWLAAREEAVAEKREEIIRAVMKPKNLWLFKTKAKTREQALKYLNKQDSFSDYNFVKFTAFDEMIKVKECRSVANLMVSIGKPLIKLKINSEVCQILQDFLKDYYMTKDKLDKQIDLYIARRVKA